LFQIPSKYITTESKIEYLRTTSYRLDNDITIKFGRSAGLTAFVEIGGTEKNFSGFFNGNNKNITIEGTTLSLNSYFDSLAIFGYTTDAVLTNMNVNVDGAIKVTYNRKTTYIGMLAGVAQKTQIYNNTVTVKEGSSIGVDYATSNDYYERVYISPMIGTVLNGCKIENCIVDIKQGASIYIDHDNDTKSHAYYCGMIAGSASGKTASDVERVIIDNCVVNMQDASAYMILPDRGFIGGMIGTASMVDIKNSDVILNNASIGITAIEDAGTANLYQSLSVGGILGNAGPGSDNTENLGRLGVSIDSCSFTSKNTVQQETLYAKIKKGSPTNVGGIIGIAYNNASVNNCKVDIEKAIFISQREEESTTEVSMGVTNGGVVGRLEHTGQIKGCSVNSKNSKIISKSTGKEIYSGGIVGIDMGPYHRKIISLQNNKFIGNGTTDIELEVISGQFDNEFICLGGIAGHSIYIMKDCKVSGVNLNFKGATSELYKACVGKIAGRMDHITSGLWNREGCQFESEDTRGVLNCTQANVNISVTGSDTTAVKTGDVYAHAE